MKNKFLIIIRKIYKEHNLLIPAIIRKIHKEYNLSIPVILIASVTLASAVAYFYDVEDRIYFVGVLISLVAAALGALIGYCHKAYLAYKNFSSFSEIISAKKTSLDVSLVFPFYNLRGDCVDILSKNGIGYEYCFQKSDDKTGTAPDSESQKRIFNQKDLVARDDLESLVNISSKTWEMYHTIPDFKDFSQINESGDDQQPDVAPGNYIAIGLYGNELTEYYCDLEKPLFSLSPQTEETHGRLSISIDTGEPDVEGEFTQVTDYPVDPVTKEKLRGKARGLDYGIIARHYMPFGGGERHTCWFIGGLAGPGTVAASRYFRENYDELFECVRGLCKKEKMTVAKASFVAVVAVERRHTDHIMPCSAFLMAQDGRFLRCEKLGSKKDQARIEAIKARTKKQMEETHKLLTS